MKYILISALITGLLPSIAGNGWASGRVMSSEALLSSVRLVEDVACRPPEGISFKSTGGAEWSLKGSRANKSATVVLTPEDGAWDVSDFSFVRIDLVNTGSGLVWIRGRLDNPGAKDWADSTQSTAFIMPGEHAVLGFSFPRSEAANDAPAIFNEQWGKPNGHQTHWKPFNPANVRACRLAIQSTSERISLENITVSLAYPYGLDANADRCELPYLDRFGQVLRLDWDGKLHAQEELDQRRAAEEKALAEDPAPKSFDRFGGWSKGPKREATGYFRTEKYQGKWWLVDPLGNLFFSHGANSVGFGQSTPIEGRKALFEWLPEVDDSLKAQVLKKSKAHFMIANLIRTYGGNWRQPANDRVHRRLRQWGMNTLGAWSDPQLVADRRTSYTAILHVGHKYSALGEGISDPFFEEFKKSLRSGLEKILGSEGSDPWCIGVFIDNEIAWTHKFVHEALMSDPQQPARQAAVRWLEEKYGMIGKLNNAWRTDFSSWDEMQPLPADSGTDRFNEDILELRKLIAGEYYRVCRDTMREVLPNHLYLGSRMHNAPDEIIREAVKYVDVLSLNSYEYLSGAKVPGWADLPCLDTEFHFCAPDRGVPGVGLMPVGDQLQRSRAYVAYVTGGLRHPCIVGTHWFAYTDQSAAGRPGENNQIGFVDVTDTPYLEIASASRRMAERIYDIRASGSDPLLDVLEELWSGE